VQVESGVPRGRQPVERQAKPGTPVGRSRAP